VPEAAISGLGSHPLELASRGKARFKRARRTNQNVAKPAVNGRPKIRLRRIRPASGPGDPDPFGAGTGQRLDFLIAARQQVYNVPSPGLRFPALAKGPNSRGTACRAPTAAYEDGNFPKSTHRPIVPGLSTSCRRPGGLVRRAEARRCRRRACATALGIKKFHSVRNQEVVSPLQVSVAVPAGMAGGQTYYFSGVRNRASNRNGIGRIPCSSGPEADSTVDFGVRRFWVGRMIGTGESGHRGGDCPRACPKGASNFPSSRSSRSEGS
jgi:hypothetical protein